MLVILYVVATANEIEIQSQCILIHGVARSTATTAGVRTHQRDFQSAPIDLQPAVVPPHPTGGKNLSSDIDSPRN
jgi:hypothetical protein